LPVVRDHKDRRVKPVLREPKAIPVQPVKAEHRDPKDRRVKPDLRDPKGRRVKQDPRDQRAIQAKPVKRDPRVRKAPTVRKDLKVFKARLVRPGRLLNPRSALLPDQTGQRRAMKMRFWFRSSARRGRLMVKPARREARRQACACESKPVTASGNCAPQ
jgi:hypothetical protein